MPPFQDSLDPAQIEAVAEYVATDAGRLTGPTYFSCGLALEVDDDVLTGSVVAVA